MSINALEGLREYASSLCGGLGGDALEHYADRIEREVAERFVELPVDADGEVIHIGDVMECEKLPNGKRVCGEVKSIGNGCVWLINVQYKIHAEYLHHHTSRPWRTCCGSSRRR